MKRTADTFPRAIWLICLAAILILALNVARGAPGISEVLAAGGGDDLMRLQQVRDWLGGQSWFDTTQYRLLPPEGVSIHWSRYVDLGIAAFLVPASWFLSQSGAEHVAVILWPTFLACLAVLVIGFANNRLLGPAAALGALVTFLTWSKLGGEFTVGRVDHHNVQMLCATVVFYLSLLPGQRGRLGIIAGAMTALCLAIGLEMLPFLALLWGMMVLRHAFGEAGVDRWLVGFCLAFAVAAPVLLVGQTPMSGWWVNHCDVMAPPLLALAAVGIVATLVPVVLARAMPHPAARILVSLALTGAGVWLAAPLLQPCLAGPYTTPEVRLIIETQINEALSAAILFRALPKLLLRVLLPPLVIGSMALAAAWLVRDRLSQTVRIALLQSFVVLLVGFGFSLVQIRAANLITPALPLLAGFLVHAFTMIPREHRLRVPAALLLVVAIPAVLEGAARKITAPGTPVVTAEANSTPSTARNFCRNTTVLAEIASLPSSIVFSSGNLGPAILAFTPHSATSAWYHRSTTAFLNGISAFESRDSLATALASSRAEYLVVCVGLSEERFIDRLADDGWPAWLVEETGDRKAIRVFRIEKTALARAVVPQ